MLFDATFVDMINAVSKDLKENDVMLILQSLTLKQQRLLPISTNIRFVNDIIITSADLLPNKESTTT